MTSSRLAGLLIGLLALGGCDWDVTQFILYPSVEQRVQESLGLPAPGPPVVNPDSFRFALFGDPQVRADLVHRLGRFTADVADSGIAFFGVLGDLTHDATEIEVHTIRAAFDSTGIPCYTTIGNHDLFQAESWERCKDVFGPATYSVVVADRLKLIFLDTASGTIGPTQFDWLETELDDNGRHLKIVCTHYPLYDGSTPIAWRLGSTAERARLQSLLRDYRAWGYVSGHIHGWRHTEVAGVNHFICGTMSAHPLDYGEPGYLLLTFAHDSLAWRKVDFE